jgi:hypothetical protein
MTCEEADLSIGRHHTPDMRGEGCKEQLWRHIFCSEQDLVELMHRAEQFAEQQRIYTRSMRSSADGRQKAMTRGNRT